MRAERPGLDDERLRPEIALSWRRSEAGGLTPSTPTDRLTVTEIDRRSRLVVAATPVLDEMAEQLAGTAFCVVLADRDSRIVDRRFDARAVELALDGISAVPGCQFTEETTGTNSIATPFELRRGVTVHGDEHFLDALKPFSCYGHPIVHPATRRLEGVLDITGRAQDANPLLAPFLRRAVADIEVRLLAGARQAEQRLFAAFQAVRHGAGAVLALGDDVVLANAAAVDLVEPADHALLREVATDLPALGRVTRGLRLTSGGSVDVRVERISGGALFELAAVERSRTPVPRRRVQGGVLSAQADRDLRRHGAEHTRVLVTGEPGTGRTSSGRVLAGGAAVAVLDAADLPALGAAAWCARLDELVATHPGLVLVEGVHLLPDAVAARLCRVLDTSAAWVALTAAPLDEPAGELAALSARCTATVELPPLRNRRADLPELVRAMVARHLPGRSLRFTASALDLLAARTWPGNLRELESVLRQAAAHRAAGDITGRDLPEPYRTAPRTHRLTAWEQAEHDAISKALAATGGNKVHAAEHLGISRSTLYNRIRVLGITS
ncbi:sigma-54-dependent Fis family transcriptional regulator [Actinokineospora sp.]|uniref:sigma-54-dependent Fis family transcriptional regulator n=1 Tax=Actinokineospora sp. TaxID=1872133 RepID=UPI004037DC5B